MPYRMGDDILPAWIPGSGRQRKSSPWRFALYAIVSLAAYQGLVVASRVRYYSYFTTCLSDVSFTPHSIHLFSPDLPRKGIDTRRCIGWDRLWSKWNNRTKNSCNWWGRKYWYVALDTAYDRRVLTLPLRCAGKHLVHRLLSAGTPVTVVDKIFYYDELESLSPSSQSLLQLHLGDIRNTTVLSAAFTPDVVGVIHLAAISRPEWCADGELDCWDVNKRGTQLVLDGLTNLNEGDDGQRWFVLASSSEVYGDPGDHKPIHEDAERHPVNVYGATNSVAESTVQDHLRSFRHGATRGSLHAVSLRLSTVYGGARDHVERLIPSIVTHALSHQVIQFPEGSPSVSTFFKIRISSNSHPFQFDLLHIDDCVEAFHLAISHLHQSKAAWWQWNHQRTSFEAFNIGSGILTPAVDILDMLVKLARSKSPIRYIPGDIGSPRKVEVSVEKAQTTLGFRAAVDVDVGLRKLVASHMRVWQDALGERLKNSCGSEAPSLVANTQLEKLHECVVHIDVDVQGEFSGLHPPDNNDKTSSWTTYPGEMSRLRTSIFSHGDETSIRIWGVDAPHLLGVSNVAEGLVALGDYSEADLQSGDVVDWTLNVNVEDSTVRLTLADGSYQLMPPNYLGGNFSLAPLQKDVFPFRITPICCPSPAPWPFMYDDRESAHSP